MTSTIPDPWQSRRRWQTGKADLDLAHVFLPLRAIVEQLTPHDQLFINTTGHGGTSGHGRGPDLIAYPHCEPHERHDFCGRSGNRAGHW